MGNLAMRALNQRGNVMERVAWVLGMGNRQGLGVQHGLVNHTS